MADRKFARLYYDQFMEEFGDIYADDAALSAWIWMLVLAEKMWPIHPEFLARRSSRRSGNSSTPT